MAKKKRSVARKPAMQQTCRVGKCHGCMGGLTAIALAFFVITVWPAAMDLVHAVHWGYWLAITIILGILCKMRCYK